MMKWMKLAIRNILRNKRRSIFTLIAIGVGFASISMYYGYIHYAYYGLRILAICGEGLGHLRINKAGWQENGLLDPKKYMFSQEDTQKVIRLVAEEKDVILATPQIQVMGLVTNGITSTVFVAQGVVPRDEKTIGKIGLNMAVSIPESAMPDDYMGIDGQALSAEKLYGVQMAKGLARHLNFKPGKEGVVMAQTLNGYMNALDMQISGIYDTGNDFSNDKFMRLNFYFAQSLLDTKSAERIVVLLKDWKETEKMRILLLKKFRNAGIDCEIKTWQELSWNYSKTKSYLDSIFMFLFSIVLIIVMMTTINTMSMSILERTREIGTLRALGLKRKGVSILFALEGAIMGFFGSIVGIILHICMWGIIREYPFHYTPAGFSVPMPLMVDMVPWALLVLLLGFVLLSTVAAIIPARRAAGKNIVDALGHA